METFVIIAVVISIFWLGIATGAIIENTRIQRNRSTEALMSEMTETKEILLPLIDKIDKIDLYCGPREHETLVAYELQDPDMTLELPIVKEEQWRKNQRSWED
jgi:hypothetical protein